jgi:hypothetical protein
MPVSRTTLETANPERYMRLVCSHWKHRFPVELETDRARIDFGDSACRLSVRPEGLHIEITAQAEALPELEDIVIDHLQRFAPRGISLQVAWTRDD